MPVRSRIRELREQRKLTQSEVAKLIGSTQDRISRLENDAQDITAEEIEKLRKVFKVKSWELFTAPEADEVGVNAQR